VWLMQHVVSLWLARNVLQVLKVIKRTLECVPFFRCSINFEVAKGKLVAVVGSVGSGKSSLLYSLLGEMNVLSGSVTMQVRIDVRVLPPPTKRHSV